MLTSHLHFILHIGLELQHPFLKTHPYPLCHSARRACPELQNLLFFYSEGNLSHGEKVLNRADEGRWIEALPWPIPTVCEGLLSFVGLFQSCKT